MNMRVDYNVGTFTETNDRIFDELWSVIRGNYRYLWQRDLLGNPPARTAGFQFGFSTYF